jgi:RNA polymerase sigma-70 factor, ECF subfamily
MENYSGRTNEVFLVLRSQTGDVEAFGQLLRSVQVRLYGYIVHLVGDRNLAEDVLQEVFLIIYRKIGWLENPKLFRAWAYRIASRQSFRHLKKEMRWSNQVTDEELLNNMPAVETEAAYDAELKAQIPSMLTEVSPASRAVVILHYLYELTLNETAEILNISVGTAKSRLAYGLATLRRLIKKEG